MTLTMHCCPAIPHAIPRAPLCVETLGGGADLRQRAVSAGPAVAMNRPAVSLSSKLHAQALPARLPPLARPRRSCRCALVFGRARAAWPACPSRLAPGTRGAGRRRDSHGAGGAACA